MSTYHKVSGQDECYQSSDGRITVQIFRYQDEVSWLAFVDGVKMFSEFPTKEMAIAGAEGKAGIAVTERQPCETCKGDGCCPTCHGAGELIESLREQLRDAEFNNFRV